MTIHAVGIGTCSQSMTIPSYLPSEMHLQKSLRISTLDREFPSWSLRKTEESRARIAVDQEIEATSSLKDIISPNINYGKRFLWLWRIVFDDGEQNWNGATILLIWSTKLASVQPWQDKKGETLLHRAEDWRMFSVEDNWVLFKKRRL